jgi:hypothetical protein
MNCAQSTSTHVRTQNSVGARVEWSGRVGLYGRPGVGMLLPLLCMGSGIDTTHEMRNEMTR